MWGFVQLRVLMLSYMYDQILLVMSDRTDEFRELCVYMYYVLVHVSPLKLLIMYYMSVMYKRSAFFSQLSLPVKMTTTI
jgi:hypothetical protein